MINVVLGVPHGDRATMQFYNNVLLMQAETAKKYPDVQFTYAEIECHMVSLARNKIVQGALGLSADYIFWIDDDMLVPANAFNKLYEANEPVISGLYFTRLYPHTPQIYQYFPEKDGYAPLLKWEDGIFEVDAVGSGCMLVRTDIYTQLALAPCAYARKVPLSPWYEFLASRGEDFYFCDRLRDIGIPVLVDTTIIPGHLSTVPIGLKEYNYLVHAGLIVNGEPK